MGRPMRPIEAEGRLQGMLEAAGLDPDRLDVWEAWKIFKAFTREPVQSDGDGIAVGTTVETTPEGSELVHLEFYRQFTAIEEEAYEPTWFAGIGLVFPGPALPEATDLEIWSYDFPTFHDFIARVEQEPVFQRAAALGPVESSVIGGEI